MAGMAQADVLRGASSAAVADHRVTSVPSTRRPLLPDITSTLTSRNGKSNSVSVLDLLQLRNVKTIAVGSGPTGIAASPTRNEIYVANADSNNISIIDAETQPGGLPSSAFIARPITCRFRRTASVPMSPIPVRQMFR